MKKQISAIILRFCLFVVYCFSDVKGRLFFEKSRKLSEFEVEEWTTSGRPDNSVRHTVTSMVSGSDLILLSLSNLF